MFNLTDCEKKTKQKLEYGISLESRTTLNEKKIGRNRYS